jgi:3-hydroxyacyl-[acyl-carrier-protein] dehydratase
VDQEKPTRVATKLNINQIKRYLPHRYPFLFVDVVDDVVPGEWIRCRKAVSVNEGLFTGHFPGNPVLPGVIQIEAMSQAGALLAIMSGAQVNQERSVYVTAITDCRFRRPVVPGDMLDLRARVLRYRLGTWKLGCEVWVGDVMASMATVTATSAPVASETTMPEGLPEPAFEVF